MHYWQRNAAAAPLYYLGLERLYRWRTRRRLRVLLLHHVCPDWRIPSESRLNITPEALERLALLLRRDYQVLSLSEALDHLDARRELPPYAVVVTFDDGYDSFYDHAWPVLAAHDIPATVFLVPSLVGTSGYLTWDQCLELTADPRVSFGSHTLTHDPLSLLSDEEQSAALSSSREEIRRRIPNGVNVCAYPFGDFDERARRAVASQGYRAGLACGLAVTPPTPDRYAIPRLMVDSGSPALLAVRVSGVDRALWRLVRPTTEAVPSVRQDPPKRRAWEAAPGRPAGRPSAASPPPVTVTRVQPAPGHAGSAAERLERVLVEAVEDCEEVKDGGIVTGWLPTG